MCEQPFGVGTEEAGQEERMKTDNNAEQCFVYSDNSTN